MRRVAMRAMVALLAGVLAAGVPVLAGPAAADDSPYPVDICATIQVSTTVPQPGEDITVQGVNFLSNTDVHLVLKPVRNNDSQRQYDLGTVRSDGRGEFRTVVRMPSQAQGTYDLHATSGAPNSTSCPADPSQRLTIGGDAEHRNHMTDNNNGPDSTAFTGLNVLLLIIAAAILIGIGIYATRRGRERTDTTV